MIDIADKLTTKDVERISTFFRTIGIEVLDVDFENITDKKIYAQTYGKIQLYVKYISMTENVYYDFTWNKETLPKVKRYVEDCNDIKKANSTSIKDILKNILQLKPNDTKYDYKKYRINVISAIEKILNILETGSELPHPIRDNMKE